MEFSENLKEGQLLKRYKRFFADIDFKGETLLAHVPNTGSLKSCLIPNQACRFTESKDPKRKLKFTLQMVKTPSSWVGVNTGLPNLLVFECWENAEAPLWRRFDRAQKEVKISTESRIDMVLWKSKDFKSDKIQMKDFDKASFHFVEVKNVTLAEQKTAFFPDAVTERGQKHLLEMMKLIKQGHSAELVFTVQREDCQTFRPAEDIDPAYAKLLRQAVDLGLTVSAWPCEMEKKSIRLLPEKALKIEL